MEVEYIRGISLVLGLERHFPEHQCLKWLATSHIDMQALFRFIDSFENIVLEVRANTLDQLMHIKCVSLSLEKSFYAIALAADNLLCDWALSRSRWNRQIEALRVRGAENSIVNLMTMKSETGVWIDRLEEQLSFLPDYLIHSDCPSNSEKLILAYLSNCYREGKHIRLITQQFARQLEEIELSIPTGEFNDRFPILMSPAFLDRFELEPSTAVAECDLCHERTAVCVECPQCIDKVICYNCYRQTAWSYQHDEHRAFSTWHSIFCPLCRYLLDEPHVASIQPFKPESIPKRRKIDSLDLSSFPVTLIFPQST